MRSDRGRRMLELDLRKAVAAGEFEVFYQPIVNLSENKISGFEALLRWNHPTRGRVQPDEFIPLAEETGLIVPIGERAIRQACAEAKTWPSDVRVVVNVRRCNFAARAWCLQLCPPRRPLACAQIGLSSRSPKRSYCTTMM
jgi:EAL domain-containing protein (putative c-di-GMP-specific phosphodiesterase class I)